MIQYYQKPKTRRNNRIWLYHLEGKSDIWIAAKYNISRQWVRVIKLKYAEKQGYAHKGLDK